MTSLVRRASRETLFFRPSSSAVGVVSLFALPLPVRSGLGSGVVGFSGSRSVIPAVLPLVLSGVGSESVVFVGCASGVDSVVRSAVPSARVFRVVGGGRCAFALRSVRFVRALASSGGVLFSFPSGACPAVVVPSSVSSVCFCGGGSGSWASLAFALGCGVPSCVWLGGVVPPASFGLVAVGGGWWVSLPF